MQEQQPQAEDSEPEANLKKTAAAARRPEGPLESFVSFVLGLAVMLLLCVGMWKSVCALWGGTFLQDIVRPLFSFLSSAFWFMVNDIERQAKNRQAWKDLGF